MVRRRRAARRSRSYSRFDDYGRYDGWGFAPYVPVAARKAQAKRKLAALLKAGQQVAPIEIDGRKIAKTFWGESWCRNLEAYSDYSNRLPRGRTYVRNGSVINLQIAAGRVDALVSGSEIYTVAVEVASVARPRWKAICGRCAGGIDSLVELLQGRFSKGVMEHLCAQGTGLFPTPREIKFSCSCPDWASMCKHVAAVLYGVGARLDHQPELLFRLRQVNEHDLLATAGTAAPLSGKAPEAGKVLDEADLGAVFGVDLAEVPGEAAAPPVAPAGRRKAAEAGARVSAGPKAAAPPVAPARPRSAAEAEAHVSGPKAAPKAKRAPKPKGAEKVAFAALPVKDRKKAAPKAKRASTPREAAEVTFAPLPAKDRKKAAPKKKRAVSPAARQAAAERMREYWAQRRGK